MDYNAVYQGQDVKVVKLESEFVNTPTTVEITKTDITSNAELSGATLTVTDSKGNVIDTWTSVAGEAHVIKRLHVGEVYTLVKNLPLWIFAGRGNPVYHFIQKMCSMKQMKHQPNYCY